MTFHRRPVWPMPCLWHVPLHNRCRDFCLDSIVGASLAIGRRFFWKAVPVVDPVRGVACGASTRLNHGCGIQVRRCRPRSVCESPWARRAPRPIRPLSGRITFSDGIPRPPPDATHGITSEGQLCAASVAAVTRSPVQLLSGPDKMVAAQTLID